MSNTKEVDDNEEQCCFDAFDSDDVDFLLEPIQQGVHNATELLRQRNILVSYCKDLLARLGDRRDMVEILHQKIKATEAEGKQTKLLKADCARLKKIVGMLVTSSQASLFAAAQAMGLETP